MENVRSYIKKLHDLAQAAAPLAAIDRDLMLDYTRRLYDALLDEGTQAQGSQSSSVPADDHAVPAAAPETVIPATEATEVQTLREGMLPPEAAWPDDTEEKPAPPEPLPQPAPVTEPLPQEPVKGHTTDVQDNIPFDIHTPAHEETPASVPAAQTEQPEVLVQPLVLSDLSGHHHPRPAAGQDIRSYISIADKYHFINELFRNNAEAYEEILDELNNQEVVEDAYMFLNNSGVTTLYKWDNDSDAVHLFYDMLTRFFAVR